MEVFNIHSVNLVIKKSVDRKVNCEDYIGFFFHPVLRLLSVKSGLERCEWNRV